MDDKVLDPEVSLSPEGSEETPDVEQEPSLSSGSGAPSVDSKKKWYVLKVQSGREGTICSGLQRRIAIAG